MWPQYVDSPLLPQANPDPHNCLGVFGLSLYTTERDLREVFSKYGPLTHVNIVYDQQSRRSRGFAFVYFENCDDSKEAKERANGMELDGRRIRVDFSITKRAHTPTPGIYMGRPT
ncbi:Transformer-2 beta [Liparis tanakae]|uniref:Transformer-2 beta n=1 Tax=Liparis tanakae TaxID=230148 RepID=A0A4Z2E8K8_9TELE|nr:Transformer-2 beta [Liparis tanakae]